MAKAKTLKPTHVLESARGRIARWIISDGIVVASPQGVYLYVEEGSGLLDVEELGLALKAANLYHLNTKGT